MSVETAVFTDDVSTLAALEEDYDRVYFGNEFCDKRLPDPEAVTDAYDYCTEQGLDMTLVSPIMTPMKTSAVESILEAVEPFTSDLELVFNDWGVYQLATEFGDFEDLVAGRTMSGQKRAPEVSHLTGDTDITLEDGGAVVTDGVREHFKKSIVNVPYARDHLEDLGVGRIELDVLSHDMYDEDVQFSTSIYYPWNFVTVKRWCQESTSAPLCDENCADVVFSLDNQPVTPERLYRMNNAIFTYNEDVPDLSYVDREVFIPDPVN
ncbi:MAG: hypothetical protein ABEJ84_03920 [Halodesulfurarchaeum sp.]